MKTKYFKIIKIIIIAVMLVMGAVTTVNADTGILAGADEFIEKGEELAGDTGKGDTAGAVNMIGGIMVSIAGYILVIGVIVVGIKYMLANPEGKAKLKGQLVGLAVATFVIYGAQAIWAAIISIF